MNLSQKVAAPVLLSIFCITTHTFTRPAPWLTHRAGVAHRHPAGELQIGMLGQTAHTPHLPTRTEPRQQNVLQNIAWTVYAYPLVEVLCQECIYPQKNRGRQSRLLSLFRATTWGGAKELFIKMLWDCEYKKSAIVAHLILQNLGVLKTQCSFKKMTAEAVCKTFMPPLLIFALHKRRQALRGSYSIFLN